MTCEISWNVLSLEAWKERFARLRRANLLQSYDYALAACAVNKQTARWGLIKIDGVEAGLVQMLEAKVLGQLFHALVIDRGPLWFEGFGSQDHVLAFTTEINRQFPKRIGRARRFIPEVIGMKTLPSFQKTGAQDYQTIWLDLSHDEEDLRANLNQRWRRSLKKAEKAELDVTFTEHGEGLKDFLMGYVVDKDIKGYDGASLELFMAMRKTFAVRGNMLVGHAKCRDKICASVLILCHGSSATYQAGWSDSVGRDKGAHQLLLWRAILALKARHIKDFDLGGVNDGTAKGVKEFKQGMGGELITLSGLYT